MRGLVVLLLAGVLFAGCTEEDPGAVSLVSTPEGRMESEVPTWEPGFAWTFLNAESESETFVVTAAAGGTYTLNTSHDGPAFFDALWDISFMGPVRAADLAGNQGGSAVQFFAWPLAHGKTWSATWDGNDYDLVAHEIGDGAFHILAQQGNETRVEYLYDPEVKWWDWIQWNDENGTLQHRLDLQKFETNWSGEVVTVQLQDVLNTKFTSPSADTINIPVSDDLYVMAQVSCEVGYTAFAMGPAGNAPSIVLGTEANGYSAEGPCPYMASSSFVIAEAPYEDNWGYGFNGQGEADIHLIARTFVRTPYPAP